MYAMTSHNSRLAIIPTLFGLALLPLFLSTANAQSVCLPLPRLLTISPMGGMQGTSFDVTIKGENLDEVDQLQFESPNVQAAPKTDDTGKALPNQFTIKIAGDCPIGLVDARVSSRLGISSARVFSVGALPEVSRTSPNTTLATAMKLSLRSVCNAFVSPKSVDYYSFDAHQGQRFVIHCASRGIDSKLDPVVFIADETGRELVGERQGNAIVFQAKREGTYVVKINDLTYRGGPEYFYRLSLDEASADSELLEFPTTRSVSAFSWPPNNLPPTSSLREDETATSQVIALPCDISGRFFPEADVDTYEFNCEQGETWWVEVASERLGRPCDPSIVVQLKQGAGAETKWNDVVELNDISSPMKPSSNGYAYDGPPFDGGSPDILGRFEAKQAGTYRILLTDLFGGTRRDPHNRYRLIVRKAAPDFALAAWGLHMELRNGDRNALSKPLALRAGSTVALEVVAVRRDGYEGEIKLSTEGLPQGVTATGLSIPPGKTRGIVLLTAAVTAPQNSSRASLKGIAVIDGNEVMHQAHIAEMAWPVPDSWNEIPSPRLVSSLPVSVTVSETAPLTMAPVETKVWEAKVGDKVRVPMTLTKRSEFSGSVVQLKTMGNGFEQKPMFDVPLSGPTFEVELDLGTLKSQPGEYAIAFYGSAVVKYRTNPLLVDKSKQDAQPPPPQDTAEIVISEPIVLRVHPKEPS